MSMDFNKFLFNLILTSLLKHNIQINGSLLYFSNKNEINFRLCFYLTELLEYIDNLELNNLMILFN